MTSFSPGQVDLIAARARALGDATRVRILVVLGRGEQAVGQIADGVRTQQSTASKHLQVLFHAGLVQRRRAAATVIYRLTAPDLLKWLRYLGKGQIGKKAAPRTGSVRLPNGSTASRRRRA